MRPRSRGLSGLNPEQMPLLSDCRIDLIPNECVQQPGCTEMAAGLMSNQSSALICGERPPEQGPRFIIKEQQEFFISAMQQRFQGGQEGGMMEEQVCHHKLK